MLFAQELILAAEEATESSGVDLILPDTGELIAGIIAFSIVFLVVWKFALPALNKALEARQQAITGQLQEAEKAKQEAESLLTDYRQQVAGARAEANEIVEGARQSAESVRTELIAKAEADAAEVTRKAREDAATEMARAAGAVREQVATLSLDVARKVVAGSVDENAQRALVDQYIAELGRVDG